MAKANKASGRTFTPDELSDKDGPEIIKIHRAELGIVDQPCQTEADGTDSSASSETQKQSSETTELNDQSPANVDDPSSKTATDSDAQTTDGDSLTTDQESPDDVEHLVDEDEIPPYSEWTNDELRDECRTRGLAVSGSKSELVARLEEHDAAQEG